MKKAMLILLIFLLVVPNILAINIEVEKTSSDETLVIGINRPLIINVKVTNNGASDNFMFYSFFGSEFYPKETIRIDSHETKEVEIQVYPREDFEQRGHITFDYFIEAQSDGSDHKESVTIRVIDLEDSFKITANDINPESSSAKLKITNKANFDFEELAAKFSSPFFDFTKVFTLAPYEEKEFETELNKDFSSVQAGFYTIETEIDIDGKKAQVDGTIDFVENNIITTEEKKFGFIINSNVIKKVNSGNAIANSEAKLRKNIITRLFTTFNPEPDAAERKGLFVYYTWESQIKPGETLAITARTNWLFPFLIIFFIGAIFLLTKQFSKTNIVLKKRISFVQAKGGEFALKVSIFVQARKYLERVTITDRLPALVRLHERFGTEAPTRVNEKARTIDWQYEKLEAGEVRILNYIIYSKVGIIGKFALPSARAIYERDGKLQEAESNKTFFLAEQLKE